MNRTLTVPIALALSLFTLLIVLERWHTYSEPLERDIATYAVIGHEMGRGRALYSDLWDHKPPGVHITNWLMEKVVPYGPAEVYALGVLAAVLTLLGVYFTGSLVSVEAGLWAAAFWTAICSDMMLQANQPNVEVFLNIFLIWGFFLAMTDRIGLAGVLFAFASFYKPQAFLPGFLLMMALILFKKEMSGWKARSQMVLSCLWPVVALWTGVFLFFKWTGQWDDFYGAVAVYNRYYVGSVGSNLLEGLSWRHLFPECSRFLGPVLVFIVGTFFLGERAFLRTCILSGVFSVGIFLLIAMPAHFFNHYYQLWLPMVAVATGWSVVVWNQKFTGWGRGVGLVCLLLMSAHEVPNFFLAPREWSVQKYGPAFADATELGQWLNEQMTASETFLVLNNNTTFYFAAQKDPPSGMVYIDPVFEGPLKEELQRRMINDLDKAKPDLLILIFNVPPDYYKRFLGTYRIWDLGPRYRHYIFMVRRGSELDERILLGKVRPDGKIS